MPAPAQTPAQIKAPAVQEVAPATCTAATADGIGTDSDGGHVTPEAAAAGGKASKANKKCPCPNCRPPAPAVPAPTPAGSASAKPGKGAGSYGANVKRGGEGDKVWQLGKSAAQQGRKQQQQQQQQQQQEQQGGGKAAAATQAARAAQQAGKAAGKGGKGSKGSKQFDVKALPAKPLMAAPTRKQVTEAKASANGRGQGMIAVNYRELGRGAACSGRQPSAARFGLLNGLTYCCNCVAPFFMQPQPEKPKESIKVRRGRQGLWVPQPAQGNQRPADGLWWHPVLSPWPSFVQMTAGDAVALLNSRAPLLAPAPAALQIKLQKLTAKLIKRKKE